MAYIESHTVTIRHRKLVALAKDLRLKPVYVLGHLHALWHAALEQADDGDLSSWSDEFIAESACYEGNAPQFVSLLQKHIWLNGRVIHDWLDYAGKYLRECKYRRNPKKWEEILKKHNSLKTLYMTETLPVNASKPNQTNQTEPNQTKLTKRMYSFESVWERYPNKDGRKQAERSFDSSVKTDQDFKDINIALDNYLKSERVAKGFIKNGSTWFNNWKDWLTIGSPSNNVDRFQQALAKARKDSEAINAIISAK